MKKNSQSVIIIVLLFVFIYFLSLTPINIDITDEYIELLPSLILMVISIYGLNNTRGPVNTFSYGLLGFGLAYMSGVFYDLGIVVNNIVTATFTLQYLQVVIVVFCLIIGLFINNS